MNHGSRGSSQAAAEVSILSFLFLVADFCLILEGGGGERCEEISRRKYTQTWCLGSATPNYTCGTELTPPKKQAVLYDKNYSIRALGRLSDSRPERESHGLQSPQALAIPPPPPGQLRSKGKDWGLLGALLLRH